MNNICGNIYYYDFALYQSTCLYQHNILILIIVPYFIYNQGLMIK